MFFNMFFVTLRKKYGNRLNKLKAKQKRHCLRKLISKDNKKAKLELKTDYSTYRGPFLC